jgi:hypothetical protein
MILNIQPIIQRIRETDFATASPAKARAIYGILIVLEAWIEDGNDLILRLLQSQPRGFLHDEQSIDGYEASDVLWATLPLKEPLGWTHKVEIEQGVEKLFHWYKQSLA